MKPSGKQPAEETNPSALETPKINPLLLVAFVALMFFLAYASGSVLWDVIVNGERCGNFTRWSTSARCISWKTAKVEMILRLLLFAPIFAGTSFLSVGGVFTIAELFKARRTKK